MGLKKKVKQLEKRVKALEQTKGAQPLESVADHAKGG